MAIDWTKPIQTRDGLPARFLCKFNAMNSYDHVVVAGGKYEEVYSVSACGKYSKNDVSPRDIENVPQKQIRWINLYPPSPRFVDYGVHESKQEADKKAVPGRIACIRIEYEEGEGLE